MSNSLPAIVGAAQVIQRPEHWSTTDQARGPVELMHQAAIDAADDAGAPELLRSVDWIGVVGGFWRYHDPGFMLGRLIGADAPRTAIAAISGSAPQDLVGVAAERIARGEINIALIVGGETGAARRRIRAGGEEPTWTEESEGGEPEQIGGFDPAMLTETALLGVAATSYSLLDDSLRRHRGQTLDEHRDAIAELWAGFSKVAAANPYAWDRVSRSAGEIREPSASNRMIAFPYTKALVANNTVDMASALLLCSEEAARSFGIAEDRLVYPHSSTASHETWQIINRRQLHETPALAAAGRIAMERAGVMPSEFTHIDLYACFPVIVRMSCESLDIPISPSPTITGGLGFAGAPVANSSGQALAAMVPLLRDGGWGFIHANGGMATKHGFGVYSATPPEAFVKVEPQDDIDLAPRDAAPADWLGDGPVEAMTVVYDREGPTHLIAAQLTPEGERALLRSADRDLIDQAMTDGLDEFTGRLPAVERIL